MATDRTNTGRRWKAITPSDTAWIEPTPTAVYVGGAGTVVAEGDDGVTAPFIALAGGELPIQPRRILATGTTATSLVGIYSI